MFNIFSFSNGPIKIYVSVHTEFGAEIKGFNLYSFIFPDPMALGIINGSYWICLIACLIAIAMYIAGQKKAGKYVSISFVIYCILQAIKGLLI